MVQISRKYLLFLPVLASAAILGFLLLLLSGNGDGTQLEAPAVVNVDEPQTIESDGQALILADLPQPLQYLIAETLGADHPTYHVQGDDQVLQSHSPEQGLRAFFGEDGVEIVADQVSLGLAVIGYGRGEQQTVVATAQPEAAQNRVIYRRGALTEWYANGPLGLQQGFTLASRPEGLLDGPLWLSLALSGDWRAEVAADGDSLSLHGPAGAHLRYGGLYVYDSTGRELPAYLTVNAAQNEPQPEELLLVQVLVDDASAVYPLTIDPLVQQARLAADDGIAGSFLGVSAAVSGDTIVVGASGQDSSRGAAYVFAKPLGDWADATQTAKLTASDGQNDDQFGVSVDISGDTVVVGTLNGEKAYIFEKPVGAWTDATQTAILSATDNFGSDKFGSAVAISGDTAVVGAPGDDSASGSAYVFVRPGSTWSNITETAKLIATQPNANDLFGSSVDIDGDTVIIGANGDDSVRGSAFVFVKPAGGWVNDTQTAKLTASDRALGDRLGISVSVSGDAIVAGASEKAAMTGAAYVYVKPAGVWTNTTETAKLTASDGLAGDRFGVSASFSGDSVLIGAPGKDASKGGAYLFEKPISAWMNTVETRKLADKNGTADDLFGSAVALDGDTAAMGAPGEDTAQGAAHVFVDKLVPELAVSKSNSSNGTVEAGETFTWTLTVSNTGPASAAFGNELVLLDELPSSGASYGTPAVVNTNNITDTLTCNIGGSLLSCSGSSSFVIGANDGRFQVTIPVTATASGQLSNPRIDGRCEVDPNQIHADQDRDDNFCNLDTVTVLAPGQPALNLFKVVDNSSPQPGQTITYTIIVANSGAGNATGSAISDPLAAGLNFVGPVTIDGSSGTPGSPPTLASGLTVPAGKSIQISFPVTVSTGLSDGTLITNTASVTNAEVSTPASSSETVTVSSTPPPSQPALTLFKVVDDNTPDAGQTITYTIYVANSGTADATGAVISDVLASGLNFVGPVTISGTSGTAGSPPTLASGLTISAGTWIQVSFPVTVSTGLPGGTVITNTAAVTSTEVSTPATDSESITAGGPVGTILYLPIVSKR